jgi:hypothetical protein
MNELPDAKTIANRANAQKSTGPRTEAGKSRSSLNALKHGCSAQTMIFPGEDATHFQNFHQSYLTDLAPVGAVELGMVQTICETQWSINRIRAHEAGIFALGHEQHASALHTGGDQIIQAALTGAVVLRNELESIKTISLYLQRASRLFQSTLKQLREIQAERKANTQIEINQAADVLEKHEEAEIPFDPTWFGFVCSPEKIELQMRLRKALNHPIPPVTPLINAA